MGKRKVSVESEVSRMERRVASLESIERFLLQAQLDSLDKAEQLRKLALAVVNSKGVYGLTHTAVSNSRLRALEEFLKELLPFFKVSKRVRAKMEKFVQQGKGK